MIVRLEVADASVTIDSEAGGRLSSLVVAGRERLITRPDLSAPYPVLSWGSFVMVPWVGRMQEGRLHWQGRDHSLPADFGAHAIHGAAYDLPWTVLHAGDAEATLERTFTPDRWPFRGRATQRITLGPDALEQEVTIHADEEMPVAAGWHPWFSRGDGDLRVRVDAARALVTADDMIPTGAIVDVRGPSDLRDGPLLGDRRLDLAYVDVGSNPLVRWPDLELELSTVPGGTVQVYSPAGSVCVEPQSSWPDSMRLARFHEDTGLRTAVPGEPLSFVTRWTWRVLPAPPPG